MSAACAHLGPFEVIELRRYTIVDGERDAFATYFETYFPEAFQQLGALALGQFLERRRADTFTWLRGFTDLDAHARVKAAFYYGPLWKEHRATMNDRLIDWQDVLLLRPLHAGSGVPVLSAVDPVKESGGAGGCLAMQIFAVAPGAVTAFASAAGPAFADYAAAGARPAGLLTTLEQPNNFPQHPVREDGPYLVWLGLLPGDSIAVDALTRLFEESARSLDATGLLRQPVESALLDPTRRSRLRWLAE